MIESGYAPGVLQSHLCHLDKASESLWNYKLSQKHYRVKSIVAECRRGYVPKQVKIIFITFHSLFLFLHDEMYFGVVLSFVVLISGQSVHQGSPSPVLQNVRSELPLSTRPCSLRCCMLFRQQSEC
jgi:hypothetical protein